MITIWHNPRCSKSRMALTALQERGDDPVVRKYLDDAPSLDELRLAHQTLNIPVIDMMRSKDALFKELGLSATDGDEALLAAMAAHPALIERPIVFANGKAAIGRPTEAIFTIL
jgi:arsenate reductase (glutaredoxin)